MSVETKSDKAGFTPGAIRAGREISKRFREALPYLPESNAETLAAIIDRETAALEMYEALRTVDAALSIIEEHNGTGESLTHKQVRAALACAENKRDAEIRDALERQAKISEGELEAQETTKKLRELKAAALRRAEGK